MERQTVRWIAGVLALMRTACCRLYRFRAASPEVPSMLPIADQDTPASRAVAGNAMLGGGALGHCCADRVQRRGIADVFRVVLREPTLQLVGMFEDLLQASGHGDHLKYFLRAAIA